MTGFLSDDWDPVDNVASKRRRKKAEAEAVAQAEGYDPQTTETKGSLLKPMAPWEREKAEQGTGEYWAKNILGINSLFRPDARKTHYANVADYNETAREMEVAGLERDRKSEAAGIFNEVFTDGDSSNDGLGFLNARIAGLESEDIETAYPDDPMFAGNNYDDLTPIMQTAKILMDSHNADPANANDPWTMEDAFNHAKKYDPSLVGSLAAAGASGAGNVKADLDSLAAAQKSYVGAFEQSAIFADSIANVDRGIEMIETGEVDTGMLNGFLFNAFGLGSEAMGELNALSKNATIDKLMSFKGPTTDFEFTQSEAAAFASIMKGEDVNLGTLKTARNAIERAAKRNSTLGESAFGTMRDLSSKVGQEGTFQIYERNYAPWWEQTPDPSNPNSVGNGSADQFMSEEDALKWLQEPGNNTPANREFFNQTYGKNI